MDAVEDLDRAALRAGLARERVPRTFVRNVQLESVSTAEPMPTKPPPFLKYASKFVRCASLSGLAMPVFRNTTARYASSPAGVNSAPTRCRCAAR